MDGLKKNPGEGKCETESMRREDDRRNNELVEIGHFYAEKGNSYSAEIEAALRENGVKIQNKTPSHMLFVPRLIQSPELEELTEGEVIWNSIDDSISVIYYLQLSFPKSRSTCSRVLQWYIQRQTRKMTFLPRGVTLKVIYPGASDRELTLRMECKVTYQTLRKKTRMLLFQLNDIVESEYKTVRAILAGDFPEDLREELMTEIVLTLSELGVECPEVIRYGKSAGI